MMFCKPKKDKSNEKAPRVGFFALFRFATKFDYLLLFLGVLFSVIKALGLPLLIITYGELSTLLVDRTYRIGTTSTTNLLPIFGGGNVLTNATVEQNRLEIINDATSYGALMSIIALIMFAAGIGAVDMFNHSALKQVTRIRHSYFSSLLRQDVGWYDMSKDTNFAVKIAEDVEKIRTGISERISHFLVLIVGFVLCMSISFGYGWKLALVIVAYVPITFVTNTLVSCAQSKLTAQESSDLSVAASAAEEVLGGIRTVKAFSGENIENSRYRGLLGPAKRAAVRRGLYSGIAEAVVRFLFYGSQALAYWYGVRLVLQDRDAEQKEYTPATLMITLFGLVCSADNISKITPYLESFSIAQGSAASIFAVIDRQSPIDSMSEAGKQITGEVAGDIEFRGVHFHYPSRPEVPILQGLSIRFAPGQTVALVGSSGNGKSTCMQLLQRFYDPLQGSIHIDGHNIRDVRISWLRQTLAVVGQEPVLFATTIEENIRYGKPDATMVEIEQAARDAGAHDFIVKLREGYQTMVGERGGQISGGQKQRIAIARALIQNPRILLLDEATSALDSQSEKLVQETLDRASKGRTTLVVSHRQSAIRSADRIVFIEKGRIVEDGTHEELVRKQGAYYNMMRMAHEKEEEGGESETNEDSVKLRPEGDFGGDNETDVDTLRDTNQNTAVVEKIFEKEMFSANKHTQTERRSSTSSQGSASSDSEDRDPIQVFSILKRILLIARPEWWTLVISTIAAILIGGSFPGFAILFGEFYGALSIRDPQEAIEATNSICLGVLLLGIGVGLCALLQTFLFNRTGVNMTTRIRSSVFSAMIHQDASWYDDPRNGIGALSVRLTNDAASVQGAVGYPISGIIQSLSQFTIGTITAFIFIWKMALVLLPIAPLAVATVLFEARNNASLAASEATGIEAITKIATEAIGNIRTVASLRQEPHVFDRYCVELDKLEKILQKKLTLRGLINSLGQSIPYFGYALSLYYGGMLVANEGVPFKNIIKVSESSLYGTMILSQTLALAPAVSAAFYASHRIFKITDRLPRIRSPAVCNATRKPDKGSSVQFKSVDFAYPTRPHVQVLQSLQLDVPEGKTVALVGASGCGKSTCIQLLQRMYDTDHGAIRLGLDDIAADISLRDLRSKLSIVSQEPTLFDRTIAENIGYGEYTRTFELTDIMEAARMANIHDFIVSLPQGYETRLGLNGGQLSGGQKQRIAIARALVRNPRVLLLDEATSALDLHSEKMVQAALDKASSGRTCLVIAHRLSTVQNADQICVFQLGRVVERGTHAQLMAAGGVYARLYNTQPKLSTRVAEGKKEE